MPGCLHGVAGWWRQQAVSGDTNGLVRMPRAKGVERVEGGSTV